jgi:hypothetical protein
MSGDDDTIIIRGGKKIAAALSAPVSAKRWHFAAVAVIAFLVGLAI